LEVFDASVFVGEGFEGAEGVVVGGSACFSAVLAWFFWGSGSGGLGVVAFGGAWGVVLEFLDEFFDGFGEWSFGSDVVEDGSAFLGDGCEVCSGYGGGYVGFVG
jgi:hypothetical protein